MHVRVFCIDIQYFIVPSVSGQIGKRCPANLRAYLAPTSRAARRLILLDCMHRNISEFRGMVLLARLRGLNEF